MFWSELVENLDLVLVPTGILFMVTYHVYLAYRIIKYPETTVIGFENSNKRVWVQQMIKDVPQYTSLALQVVSSNISAAVYLASLSLTISSLIGTIVAFAEANRSSATSNQLVNEIFFGNKSSLTSSIKYASLLLCFLVAFISYVQCTRYYIHVSFLISTPNSGVPEDYVERAVIRGSNFWSLGIRAYYFAFPLLLWITGPIAMFVCSLGMISFLYFLDFTANPIPAFGIKSTSKRLREPVYDIGRAIESSSGRKHVILHSPVELR
jgi:uncharacterized membrane protein